MFYWWMNVSILAGGVFLVVIGGEEATGQQRVATEGSQLMKRLESYSSQYTNSRMRTSRLCGFLEGKYGVVPPVAWENAIAAIQAGSSPPDFTAASELTIRIVDGEVLISDKSRTIRVIESHLNRENYGPSQNLLVLSREMDVFLLDSVHIAIPYKITKVGSGGAIEWQQNLSFIPTDIGGGGATHSIEAMVTKDRLILFGAVFPVAYCGIMDRKTGGIVDWCIFE